MYIICTVQIGTLLFSIIQVIQVFYFFYTSQSLRDGGRNKKFPDPPPWELSSIPAAPRYGQEDKQTPLTAAAVCGQGV